MNIGDSCLPASRGIYLVIGAWDLVIYIARINCYIGILIWVSFRDSEESRDVS